MKTLYTIPQKMSGTGTINDIASDLYDRDIIFSTSCKYAVVLSSYYGGKGYTTHKTEAAAITASNKNKDYSSAIIDVNGNKYYVYNDRLIKEQLWYT